jgi:hypothetical protein
LVFNIDQLLFVIVDEKISENKLKSVLLEYQNIQLVNNEKITKEKLLSFLMKNGFIKDEFNIPLIKTIL